METKRDIRKMMTALRAAMSEKERAEAGRIIAARLFSSKVYEDRHSMLLCVFRK